MKKKFYRAVLFGARSSPINTLVKPEDLKNAWNSEKMLSLRKTHLNGDYQNITQCKNCVEGGLS